MCKEPGVQEEATGPLCSSHKDEVASLPLGSPARQQPPSGPWTGWNGGRRLSGAEEGQRPAREFKDEDKVRQVEVNGWSRHPYVQLQLLSLLYGHSYFGYVLLYACV